MPKFRKHSIEEKRKRSARRKKVRKETQKKAAETNQAEKETDKQEEAKQPETSIALPSEESEERLEKATANQTANTAELATGQKRCRKSEEKSDCVEEIKKKRDSAHRHTVVFNNNWMKSEKANLPLINLKDVQITERNVAKGSHGMCHVGLYGATNVGVKKIERWNDSNMEEAMILRKIRHLNIQMFLGLAWQGNDAHVISKFHSVNGRSVTLENADEKKLLSEENWRDTASQVFDAVKYLHREAEILHNDIKPNNIVVEHGQNASVLIPILIDFGKACSIHNARLTTEERDLNDTVKTLFFSSYCFK